MSSEHLVCEAQDPATTPARLAELAQADRSTWAAIVFNPSAYEGLLQWLGERGDPTVDAALAARASHAAAQLPPVPPEPATEAEPEPTMVIPTEPASEPTQPTEPTEPTVVFPPAGTATHPEADGTAGKPLAVVIGMVAVILVLIGGAAFGATQVFGGDDTDVPAASSSTPTSDAPTPSDDENTPTEDSPDDSGAPDDFCDAMSDLQGAAFDSLGGASPSDPSDLQGLGPDLVDAYDELKQSAPAELQNDVDAMSAYIDALQDPTSIDPQDLAADMTDYFDAVGRVTQYYAANCL